MEDKTSIIKILGLPEAFTAVLLIIGLILSLAPYFSGADFGLFKIPQFTDTARKKLKIIGPVIFLLLVTLFIPMIHLRAITPSDNANRSNTNGNVSPPIDIHNQVQKHIARARNLYEQTKYEDALKECEEALRLEPENQEALKLKSDINGTIDILKRTQ